MENGGERLWRERGRDLRTEGGRCLCPPPHTLTYTQLPLGPQGRRREGKIKPHTRQEGGANEIFPTFTEMNPTRQSFSCNAVLLVVFIEREKHKRIQIIQISEKKKMKHSSLDAAITPIDPNDFEAVLSKRMKQNEEMLQTFRREVQSHRQWLTSGMQQPLEAEGTTSTTAAETAASSSHHPQKPMSDGGNDRHQQHHRRDAAAADDDVKGPTAADGSTIIEHEATNNAKQQLMGGGRNFRSVVAAAVERLSTTRSSPSRRQREEELDKIREENEPLVTPIPHISDNSQRIAQSSSRYGNRNAAPIEDRLLQLGVEQKSRLEAQREAEHAQTQEAANEMTTSTAHRRRARALTLTSPSSLSQLPSPHHHRFGAGTSVNDESSAKRAAAREVRQAVSLTDEITQLLSTPKISSVSEKMAESRRAREGTAGMDIVDAMRVRDEVSRLRKSQLYENSRVIATPRITQRAAGMQRDGPPSEIGDRLHEDAVAKMARREAALEAELRALVDESIQFTHSPDITPRARNLKRKDGEGGVGAHLHSLNAKQKAQREARAAEQAARAARDARPAINPLSDIIASKIPESTRERLRRPKKRYDLQTHASSSSHQLLPEGCAFSPSINRHSEQLVSHRRTAATTTPHRRHRHGGGGESEVSTLTSGSSNTDSGEGEEECESGSGDMQRRRRVAQRLAELHDEALQRKTKLAQQRAELAAAELDQCSFAPQLSANNSLYQFADAPSLVERMDRWSQRVALRRAEGAAAESTREVSDCTFTPRTTTRQMVVEQWSPLYGGDGHAWGHAQHVDRQNAARTLRAESRRREQDAFTTGKNWRPELTKPRAPKLGPEWRSTTPRRSATPQHHHHRHNGGSASSPTDGGSRQVMRISSLIPPHASALASTAARAQRSDAFLREGERYLQRPGRATNANGGDDVAADDGHTIHSALLLHPAASAGSSSPTNHQVKPRHHSSHRATFRVPTSGSGAQLLPHHHHPPSALDAFPGVFSPPPPQQQQQIHLGSSSSPAAAVTALEQPASSSSTFAEAALRTARTTAEAQERAQSALRRAAEISAQLSSSGWA